MTAGSTATIEAVELARLFDDGTRALAGITFAAEPGEISGCWARTVPADHSGPDLCHLATTGSGSRPPTGLPARRHRRRRRSSTG
jgi:hypothetical protein